MTDHIIEWTTPERGINSVEGIVSHMPSVRAAVHDKANAMGIAAEMLLLQHRRTGAAKIRVEHAPPRKLDSYVYLEDPDPSGSGNSKIDIHRNVGGKNGPDRSAMSIEFGWTQTHAFGKRLAVPIKHDGLHILGQVMNRAASRYRGPR